MINRILLVDDEKSFLEGLKRSLNHLSNIFKTDICDSVNEAITLAGTNEYNLIITDIRMPNKSGLDLLLHLKAINFSGGIKVMSAYTTEEDLKKIRDLGIIDVISKPFDLKWFQDMLVNFFDKESGPSVTFDSIDLLSVMQVINLDKKSSELHIDINGKKGIIYFHGGEIINAKYGNLTGEDAVLKLTALNKGIITVKSSKSKVKKEIKTPFAKFIMEVMKKIDEFRNNKIENKNKNPLINKKKEEKMALETILEDLKAIKGYKASGIMTFTGDVLANDSVDQKIDLALTGATFNDIFRSAHEASEKIGLEACKEATIHTPKGIVFMLCSGVQAKVHFHMIGILATDGNLALMKMSMEKLVPTITNEIG